jgi:hypothetical protein
MECREAQDGGSASKRIQGLRLKSNNMKYIIMFFLYPISSLCAERWY